MLNQNEQRRDRLHEPFDLRRSHSAADGVVRVGRPAMTQKKTCGKQQSLQGGDMGTY